jgi:hypothetical protein
MSMNIRHAAALALVGLLSSCASIHMGPSAQELRISEQEYQECLLTNDYPTGECANEEWYTNTVSHGLDFRTD